MTIFSIMHLNGSGKAVEMVAKHIKKLANGDRSLEFDAPFRNLTDEIAKTMVFFAESMRLDEADFNGNTINMSITFQSSKKHHCHECGKCDGGCQE